MVGDTRRHGLSIAAIIALLATLSVLFAATETLYNAMLIPAAGMAQAGAASGLALALSNLISVLMLAFVMWGFALSIGLGYPLAR